MNPVFYYEQGKKRADMILHLDASNVSSYPGTGTTWTDLSGKGNNATLINGPAFIPTTYGGGISFDATDDIANITNNSTEITNWNNYWQHSNSMTICFWIKGKFAADGLDNRRDGIIGQRYFSGNGFAVDLHCNLTTSLFMFFSCGGGNTPIPIVNNNLYDGVPTFVSISHNGTSKQVRYSFNGTFGSIDHSIVVPIGTYMTNTTDNVVLQRIAGGGPWYEKTIYDMYVYNRNLADADVLRIFNATRSKFGI